MKSPGRGSSKGILRTKYLLKRLVLQKTTLSQKSRKISERCIKWLRGRPHIHCVALYSDFMNEVQTEILFKFLKSKNIDVVYPAIGRRSLGLCPRDDKTLEFFKVKNLLHFKKGPYTVLEPKFKRARVEPNDIDIMLVPGIVFDEKGFRLGYGKGYYDRVLSQLQRTQTLGLAFEFQVVRKVPRERWDRPVDILITERKVRRFC